MEKKGKTNQKQGIGVEIRDGQTQPGKKWGEKWGKNWGGKKWGGKNRESLPCVAFESSIGGDHINTGRFEREFSREY